MSNPYKELKQITENRSMNADELLHALLAAIYVECCDKCNETLHSQTFLETYKHLLSDLEFCKGLASNLTQR